MGMDDAEMEVGPSDLSALILFVASFQIPS